MYILDQDIYRSKQILILIVLLSLSLPLGEEGLRGLETNFKEDGTYFLLFLVKLEYIGGLERNINPLNVICVVGEKYIL